MHDVIFQCLIDQVCERGIELGAERSDLGKTERRFQRGIAPRYRMMHGGAERIEIRSGFGASTILLRRRVALRTDHGGVALRQEKSGDPEVNQFYLNGARGR